MSKRCKLQKEYYKEFGNYKGSGKYTDHYVNWLESKVLAINYTHCCETLKDEEIPKIDDWIKDLGYTQITFSYVYKNGGTYKDREQLCKEYKKEFCL